MADPASPQQPSQQERSDSLLDELRSIGRHIDPQFLPVGQEVVNVLGALLHLHDHPEIADKIREGQQEGKTDQEVTRAVSDVISPPPPPQPEPEQAQAPGADAGQLADLQAQVDQLKRALEDREAASAAAASAQQAHAESAPTVEA